MSLLVGCSLFTLLNVPATVELQCLEHPWNHEDGKFELMSVNHSTTSRGIIGIYIFDFPLHEGMLCVLIRIASWRRF